MEKTKVLYLCHKAVELLCVLIEDIAAAWPGIENQWEIRRFFTDITDRLDRIRRELDERSD